MLTRSVSRRSVVAAALAAAGLKPGPVLAQALVKAQVANLIVNVENGVDEFEKYLERRGENARSNASSSAAQSRRARRGQQATEAQKENARNRKDELEDALDDLDRATSRLRRKFDATDKWMETKVEVQRVVDQARDVNQAVTRGNYGSDAARLWAVLRNGINDLARAYGVPPLGV